MSDVQVRPSLSMQRLLGDLGHTSLDPAAEHEGWDSPQTGPLPTRAAIKPSPLHSKAAESAYEHVEHRPARIGIQDPVVAAATAFFRAPKEAQREAVQELVTIAKEAGPSTEFATDFEQGNYVVAFVGLVEFFLDIWPVAQVRKLFMNFRASLALRKALVHEYDPAMPFERGCLDFLLRSDIRSGINKLVKHPVRKSQFVGVVSRYVPRVGFLNEHGELKVGLQLKGAHQLDTIGGPTVDAPVRIVQNGDSAFVLIHQGDMGPGVEAKIIGFEVPAGQIQNFARDLVSDGFIKLE